MPVMMGLLLLVLATAACVLLVRWLLVWVSMRRAPIVGRVLRTPIAEIYNPRGGSGNRYLLLVQVGENVRKLDVISKALWQAAKPGQLLQLWLVWNTVAKMEVLEPARPENVMRATQALERWQAAGGKI